LYRKLQTLFYWPNAKRLAILNRAIRISGEMENPLKEQDSQILRRAFGRICLQAGLFFTLFGWLPLRAEAVLRLGDKAPKVTLKDLKGNQVALPNDFKGKVALLHFWASWCPSCRPEMTSIESLKQVYGAKGVFPCSINLGESKEAALRYINDIKITYPVLLDPGSLTVKPFGISGIPTFYILDRENVVRFKILGRADRDSLEKMIRTLL
jgi:cytochrome c biogenesis protein CcmG, thiol:disulfide interchange protein DsbE